jgi:hypothetical protein
VARHQRVTGQPAEGFPTRRTQWDFSAVADGRVYLLRQGEDFAITVDAMAAAARRWARGHDYTVSTRSEFAEDHPERPKIGLYVRFERR